ncbi:MAG: hypothetical protein U0871_25110 [Gemmataceae bacterium]
MSTTATGGAFPPATLRNRIGDLLAEGSVARQRLGAEAEAGFRIYQLGRDTERAAVVLDARLRQFRTCQELTSRGESVEAPESLYGPVTDALNWFGDLHRRADAARLPFTSLNRSYSFWDRQLVGHLLSAGTSVVPQFSEERRAAFKVAWEIVSEVRGGPIGADVMAAVLGHEAGFWVTAYLGLLARAMAGNLLPLDFPPHTGSALTPDGGDTSREFGWATDCSTAMCSPSENGQAGSGGQSPGIVVTANGQAEHGVPKGGVGGSVEPARHNEPAASSCPKDPALAPHDDASKQPNSLGVHPTEGTGEGVTDLGMKVDIKPPRKRRARFRKPTDRHEAILVEMRTLGAKTWATKTTRDEIAGKFGKRNTGRGWAHDFIYLRESGYIATAKGCGVWLTEKGWKTAESLASRPNK